jgi:hypothetical protein
MKRRYDLVFRKSSLDHKNGNTLVMKFVIVVTPSLIDSFNKRNWPERTPDVAVLRSFYRTCLLLVG